MLTPSPTQGIVTLATVVLSTWLASCTPDLAWEKGERCGGDLRCPRAYECYRSFCIPQEGASDEPSAAADGSTHSSSPAGPDVSILQPDAAESDAGAGNPAGGARGLEADASDDAADLPGEPSVDAGSAAPVALDCAASEKNCKPTCPAAAACDITCGDVSNCEVECSGACAISCAEADNCYLHCVEGANCDLDCRGGEGNCEKIRCERGASCLLRCGEHEHCKFEKCHGALTMCANGDVTCDRPCP